MVFKAGNVPWNKNMICPEISRGRIGILRNVSHSVEHSKNISISLKRYYKEIQHHNKGTFFSDAHCNNISNSLKDFYSEHVHHRKGVSQSESHRRKLSISKKIYYKNPYNFARQCNLLSDIRPDAKGVNNPFYNKTHLIETKKRLSENHKGLLVGEKNGNWKNGSSFNPYGSDFNEILKEFVRNSFGRECVLCFESENGQRLDVHHIDKNKNNNVSENLLPVHHGMCHKIAEDYLCGMNS